MNEMMPNEPGNAAEASVAHVPAAAPRDLEKEASFSEDLIQRFEADLEKDPKDALKRWGLAMFHSLPDEKVQRYRALLKFDDRDALDHYNRGCLLASEEKYGEAVKAFEEALKQDENLKEAKHNRALALELDGKKEPAAKAWNEYLMVCDDADEANEVKNHITELRS